MLSFDHGGDVCLITSLPFSWFCVNFLGVVPQISREIAPKQQALAEADELLAIMQRDLDEKRAALNKVLDEISRLEKTKADADMEMQQTEDRLDQCVARLERATKLINGLKGEKGRWTALLSQMDDRGENIVGDVLMCSGIAAYQGAFTLTYRRLLCEEWAEEMRREGVSLSEGCTLASIFGDPLEIQSWNMRTLPPDSYSIDNAMIMKLSSRWPLLIGAPLSLLFPCQLLSFVDVFFFFLWCFSLGGEPLRGRVVHGRFRSWFCRRGVLLFG